MARAAAMFTEVVVFPTPPFWLATVMTRVSDGRGHSRSPRFAMTSNAAAAARAIGVSKLGAGGGINVSRESTLFSPSMRGVTDAVSAVPCMLNAWPDDGSTAGSLVTSGCSVMGLGPTTLPALLSATPRTGPTRRTGGDQADEGRRRIDLT